MFLTNTEKLTVILYTLGAPLRIRQNATFTDIIDDAAQRWPDFLGWFCRPIGSRNTPRLDKAVHELVMDGLAEYGEDGTFIATSLLFKKDGKEVFQTLTKKERHRVVAIGQRLRAAFSKARRKRRSIKEACVGRPQRKRAGA